MIIFRFEQVGNSNVDYIIICQLNNLKIATIALVVYIPLYPYILKKYLTIIYIFTIKTWVIRLKVLHFIPIQ